MPTRSLIRRHRTRNRNHLSIRYSTRMQYRFPRLPRPEFHATCRALAAYIRLYTRLLGMRNPAAYLQNTPFPRLYAHLMRRIYHFHLGHLNVARPKLRHHPAPAQKQKNGKASVKKR